ncbi:MAG: hypothetical protein M9964_01615 [Solirubrobacterales bacterium]|nr:hypothetical protein [Solirubrobacterales bacterium]
MHRISLCTVALAVAALLAGCGGEDEASDTASPDDALACIQEGGLDGTLQTVEAPAEGDPGSAISVTTGRPGSIDVSFFGSPGDAEAFADLQDQAAAAGLNSNDTQVVGTAAVSVYGNNVDTEDLDVVTGCL